MVFREGSGTTFKSEGVVIGRRSFKDYDRLVTIYSSKFGKITALAKGAKRISSRKAGGLEIGTRANFVFSRSHGFAIITEVSPIEYFFELRTDFKRLGLGFLLFELISRMTVEEQPQEGLYSLILKLLRGISQGRIKKAILIETEILDNLGFGIPERIKRLLLKGNFSLAQQELNLFIETVIEKKLESAKLIKDG